MEESAFVVQCTGQIESGDFGQIDNLYCRYTFHIGHDWSIASVCLFCFLSFKLLLFFPPFPQFLPYVMFIMFMLQGPDTGLSQTARKSVMMHGEDGVVWNFPIDISFRATNVHGWPRLALSAYGIDPLGRDIVRGYGSVLVPISPGQHVLDVDMYVPLATSTFNHVMAWLLGNPPEFFDSKFVCQSDGREVTRVQRTGSVCVKLNVTTKGMQVVGYGISPS